MEKMTQRDYYNEIIALATKAERADIVNFAKARIEQLDKKSANRKPSKAQTENEVIKENICSVLGSASVPMTCTEIKNALGIDSLNKIVALVTQLVKADKVVRATEGKKAVFSLTPAPADTEDTEDTDEADAE